MYEVVFGAGIQPRFGQMRALGKLLLISLVLGTVSLRAGDWPMYRCDAARSGSTREELAASLHVRWSWQLQPSALAWPNEPRLHFDAVYAPVVSGGLLLVASAAEGSVTARHLSDGGFAWRFFAEGPIRFAPAVAGQRVYCGSDDGWLYCLALDDGRELWRVRGAPEDREMRNHLGNARLISFWPIRGGPVVVDGMVYFSAGIWPTMGVFVVAVDAQSGKVLWRNGDVSYLEKVRLDHNIQQASGLSPQGYLAVAGDALVVPNGRSMPAILDRTTGKLRNYVQGYRNGDCRVSVVAPYALVGRSGVIDLRTGREVGSRWAAAGTNAPEKFDASKFDLFEGPIHPYKHFTGCWAGSSLTGGEAYDLAQGAFLSYRVDAAAIAEYDVKYQQKTLHPWRWDPPLAWKCPVGLDAKKTADAAVLRAGRWLYGHAGGALLAAELPVPGGSVATPRIAWRLPLPGSSGELLAAEGCLIAVTREGRITCFGQEENAPVVYETKSEKLTPSESALSEARDLVRISGVQEGYCVILGMPSEGIVEAMLQLTHLQVIVVDNDRAGATRLRERLIAGGVYGHRVEVICSDPNQISLPPFLASLLLVAPGFPESQLARRFESLRPYGGVLRVLGSSEALRKLGVSPELAALPQIKVEMSAGALWLRREGSLPQTAAWTHECGDPSRSYYSDDALVSPPLAVLWYGDGPGYGFWKDKDYGTGVKPQVVGGRAIALQLSKSTLMAYDVFTGRGLWQTTVDRFTRYASLSDGIYVAGQNRLTILDPATGTTRAEHRFEIEPGQPALTADIRVGEDVVVIATAPEKVRVIERGLWDSIDLVALDRKSGRVLWKRGAANRFNLHAVALDERRLFCVDSPNGIDNEPNRRRSAESPKADSTILALDLHTGAEIWKEVRSNTYRTFPQETWLSMQGNDDWLTCCPTAGLVVAGKLGEAYAFDAGTGRELWHQRLGGAPLIVRGKELIDQSGSVYDARSGRQIHKGFNYDRGGCNYAVACRDFLFVRHRSVSVIDLKTRGKQSLYAIRSGCSNSLVAADGLLNVPNFSAGCVCNYPIQTSFAMFHLPQAAAWLPPQEVNPGR